MGAWLDRMSESLRQIKSKLPIPSKVPDHLENLKIQEQSWEHLKDCFPYGVGEHMQTHTTHTKHPPRIFIKNWEFHCWHVLRFPVGKTISKLKLDGRMARPYVREFKSISGSFISGTAISGTRTMQRTKKFRSKSVAFFLGTKKFWSKIGCFFETGGTLASKISPSAVYLATKDSP